MGLFPNAGASPADTAKIIFGKKGGNYKRFVALQNQSNGAVPVVDERSSLLSSRDKTPSGVRIPPAPPFVGI